MDTVMDSSMDTAQLVMNKRGVGRVYLMVVVLVAGNKRRRRRSGWWLHYLEEHTYEHTSVCW